MWWSENNVSLKVIFFVVVFLLVVERITNTFDRKIGTRKPVKVFHRGFFYLLLSAYLAIVISSCVSFFTTDRINVPVSLIGGSILAIGIISRRKAIKSLNDFWSVFIEIKEGQRLVREGIYRYLKHPYYVSVVLELTGFSLFCNAYWSLLLTFVLQVPLILIRIYYENRILDVYGRRLGFNR